MGSWERWGGREDDCAEEKVGDEEEGGGSVLGVGIISGVELLVLKVTEGSGSRRESLSMGEVTRVSGFVIIVRFE